MREGRGSVQGLLVASPEDFDALDAFALKEIEIDLSLKGVRGDPLVIQSVRVRSPVVQVKFLEDGRSNIDVLRRRIQDYASKSDAAAGKDAPPKVRIETFVLEGAEVQVDAASLGAGSRTLTLSDLRLSNVGGPQGAHPDALAKEIFGALARETAEQLARSEIKRLIEDRLGEAVQDKAKELIDKIGN